jgi:hypothetical protein
MVLKDEQNTLIFAQNLKQMKKIETNVPVMTMQMCGCACTCMCMCMCMCGCLHAGTLSIVEK